MDSRTAFQGLLTFIRKPDIIRKPGMWKVYTTCLAYGCNSLK